jgi:hypothetical protein
MRLSLLGLLAIPAFGQTGIPAGPEFTEAFREVLSAVKIGEAPSSDGHSYRAAFTGDKQPTVKLPGAFSCGGMTGGRVVMAYTCTWEAKPNKYSMAVLMDSIVTAVSAAAPDSLARTKGQTIFERYAEFTDVARGFTITVKCWAMDTDLLPNSYSVKLIVHPTSLRVLQ